MSDDDYRDQRDPSTDAANDSPSNTRYRTDALDEYRKRPDAHDRKRYGPDSTYQNTYLYTGDSTSQNNTESDQPFTTNQRPGQPYHDDRPSPGQRQGYNDRDSYNHPDRSSRIDESMVDGSGVGRPRDNRPGGVTYPVKFHGRTSEYFKIWIVNVFLTIVTLYIYSAWAKVRTKRYFYGNTTIDNSSFEYHARGGQLVAGRLIAAVLLIAYTVFQGINTTISSVAFGILVVMFPWAIWRSLRFNARASSFRNIRFGFDGSASPPYLNILIIPAVVIALFGAGLYLLAKTFDYTSIEQLSNLPTQMQGLVGVGIVTSLFLAVMFLVPLLHRNLISYSLNNHRYGTSKFSAPIKTGKIFGIYLLAALITVIAVAATGAVISGAMQLFKQAAGLLDASDLIGRFEPYWQIILGLTVYLIVIPITTVGVAYFRSNMRNYRYNATSINSNITLNSTTTTWSLWWLNISNLLMLIVSLGLAYPYTKIRSARYFADRTSITVADGLNSFTEREKTRLHALGEEMADAFDADFDIAI